jgi:hypothetical protein
MARPRRGGVRAGAPGAAYPNRTDLNANRSLPVRTVPGQTYGAALQQQNAQRLVPMAPPSVPFAPSPGPAGNGAVAGGGGAAPGPPPPLGPAAIGPSFLPPGSLTPLDAPSQRPSEPVTAGAALGAGPGPDILPQGAGAMGGGIMTALLNRAAQASGSSALKALAVTAAQQGR